MSSYDRPITRNKSGNAEVTGASSQAQPASLRVTSDPKTWPPTEGAKRDANLTLPTDSEERKNHPLLSGCLKYFPAALAGVAKVSKLGNDKHNPGQELHHARGKSMDHGDCIVRHLIDTEDLLSASAEKEQILFEANQLAWRALAYSQELHEKFGSPLAPGAKK